MLPRCRCLSDEWDLITCYAVVRDIQDYDRLYQELIERQTLGRVRQFCDGKIVEHMIAHLITITLTFSQTRQPYSVGGIPAHVGCGLCCKGVYTQTLTRRSAIAVIGARCRPLPCPFLQNNLKQMAG